MFEEGKERKKNLMSVLFVLFLKVVIPFGLLQISCDDFPFEAHLSIRIRGCRGDGHYTPLMKAV